MTAPASHLRQYRPDLSAALDAGGAPAYRHRQVYHHLTHHPEAPFAAATDLPLDVRTMLEPLGVSTLRPLSRQNDPDGTTKLLLAAITDGVALETVIMRYGKRTTVCVSSQVGCPLGCVFCATGALGFTRDLSPAEIVDQVRAAAATLATEARTVTNIVFMGMGEPLLNLDAVLVAIHLLKDRAGLGFASRSLSISTIGIPEGIRRLSREEPQVNLALSLHAADERLRSRLVPANRRYPLREVLRATADHFDRTHRKLFVEYLLLAGVNDFPRDAAALAELLRGRVVAVNLIPWNPAVGDFAPSTKEATAAFRRTLLERGIEASVRQSRGTRIAAACGQLVAGRSIRSPRAIETRPARRTKTRPGVDQARPERHDRRPEKGRHQRSSNREPGRGRRSR